MHHKQSAIKLYFTEGRHLWLLKTLQFKVKTMENDKKKHFRQKGIFLFWCLVLSPLMQFFTHCTADTYRIASFTRVNGGENTECVSDEVLFSSSPTPLGRSFCWCAWCCRVQCLFSYSPIFFFPFSSSCTFVRQAEMLASSRRKEFTPRKNNPKNPKTKQKKKNSYLSSSVALEVFLLHTGKNGKLKEMRNLGLSFTSQQASVKIC